MRQEVDIRYVVTSLKGTAQHLYEDVYCHDDGGACVQRQRKPAGSAVPAYY
jgi:hypothetical protein